MLFEECSFCKKPLNKFVEDSEECPEAPILEAKKEILVISNEDDFVKIRRLKDEGFSTSHIAEQMGTSESAIRKILAREV